MATMIKLNSLKKPIEKELDIFETRFKNSMKSNVPLLDRITYYIVQRKGKQVRPMFVFLCAKLFGPINEDTYISASLVELVHTASLVHDDVVDDSHLRRGFFSINALWKNKIAVLVGDYLLSKGLLLAVEKEQYKTLKIVSNAVKELSEGELLQLEKARRLDISEDIYFDIIRQKTASLMAAACSVGASCAGVEEKDVKEMKRFGELAGIAFQLKDDLFDYGYQNVGKPTGIDVKEKKMTLPLIYSLQKSDSREKREIINIIKNHSEKKSTQKKVVEFVHAKGGIDYATAKMIQYKDDAIKVLEQYPMNEAHRSLIDLVNYIVERNN
jgi:octaprenyl-diphosphate synthase